jgi:hypothetical protein
MKDEEDWRISNRSAKAKPRFLRRIVFIGEKVYRWPIAAAQITWRLGMNNCQPPSRPRRHANQKNFLLQMRWRNLLVDELVDWRRGPG